MGNFARHQELQSILGPGVTAKIDEPLVDDLRSGLGRNVAAKIHVEFAGYFQVIGRPGRSHRIEQIDPAAACNSDQWIGFGFLAYGLHRFKMHARKTSDDLKMAEFLGANIH